MNGKGVRPEKLERRRASGQNELVDINWIADRLGVTLRHVAEGRIPLVKWGHLLRFDPDEIERWIDEARRPSRS